MAERVDAGRVLRAGYALFVVAAAGRSTVELSLHPARAPLAYALSVLAAGCYLSGYLLLRAARHGGHRRAARVSCAVELAGVLAVGLASCAAPDAFPDATVWSQFGAGYGFVPLALPLLGLGWLCRGGGRRPVSSGRPAVSQRPGK